MSDDMEKKDVEATETGTKGTEAKPAEAAPAAPAAPAATPAEAKPAEPKPAEAAPAAPPATPAETKPAEAAPAAPPAEAKPAEPKPAEAAPAAPPATPAEAKPAEAAPAAPPAEAKPAEAAPAAAAPPAPPAAEAAPAEEAEEEPEKEEGKRYYYPNKWGRGVITSTEEIMGTKGIHALLNMAGLAKYIDNTPPDNMKKEFSFEDLSALQRATWEMYGPRGARVFAVRAGEATFRNSLAQFKAVAHAAQVAMKVGTLEAKIKLGLEFFARFFNSVSDQVVAISEDEKHWMWIIKRCPMCWGRTSTEPLCYLAVGVLQGAFEWVAPGKKFRIMPVECIAKGDKYGVIKIEKVPVE